MLSLEKAKNDMINFANREMYSNLSDDPIGLATLLFFLLNNKLESPAVDSMVAQMNAWIDEKLNEHKFTRFLDRELVSAVFGFYTLESFKRLRAKVKTETLNEILSKHMKDSHFFHNYTYSVMIALSISDREVATYKELIKWVTKRFEDETVFNDAKKLVFTAILFHQTDREKELLKLVKSCYRKLLEGSIPYYDRIYYAWVAWKYRKLLSKQSLSELTQFVKSSLENFVRQLREEELEETAKEIYGRKQRGLKPSRIALGVYIDLSKDFTSDTIIVSKEELAKTPIITRFGSSISLVSLVIDSWLFYLAISYGVIAKISTELRIEKLVSIAIVDIIVMLFFVLVAAASLSLLWDTGIKGYVDNRLIVNNMKTRVRQWIKEILIGNIIMGILVGFILGI